MILSFLLILDTRPSSNIYLDRNFPFTLNAYPEILKQKKACTMFEFHWSILKTSLRISLWFNFKFFSFIFARRFICFAFPFSYLLFYPNNCLFVKRGMKQKRWIFLNQIVKFVHSKRFNSIMYSMFLGFKI